MVEQEGKDNSTISPLFIKAYDNNSNSKTHQEPSCVKNWGRKQELWWGWGKNKICGQNIDHWLNINSKTLTSAGSATVCRLGPYETAELIRKNTPRLFSFKSKQTRRCPDRISSVFNRPSSASAASSLFSPLVSISSTYCKVKKIEVLVETYRGATTILSKIND